MITHCDDCGSNALFYDATRGDCICESCGLVAESSIISYKIEWNAYDRDEEQKKARSEYPSRILCNYHLGTNFKSILTDYRQIKGHNLQQKQYRRLARIQNQNYDRYSNLKNAIFTLKHIKSQLNLSSDTSNTAFVLYRIAQKKRMVRGRSVINMMAAAVYLACRKKELPILIKDIARVANITSKQLGKSVRLYLRNVKLSKDFHDPIIYINRLGDALNLTGYTRIIAIDILRKTRERGIVIGKSPIIIAAASIYIASIQTGERRTQAQISNIAQTTPATIRKRFKEIIRGLNIEELNVSRGWGAKPVSIDNPAKWIQISKNY